MAQAVPNTDTRSAPDAQLERLESEIAVLKRELALLRIANGELERVVVRDTLTPLYNRRHFISCLNDRIGRAARYGGRSVLILIDVDGMKTINDAYGHPAGDFVLMHIAGSLNASIRATDIAARIGGDEFALILDEIDEAGARAKVAALDTHIRRAPCAFGDAQLAVSASFGHADIRPNTSDADIIAEADARMYDRKRRRQSA